MPLTSNLNPTILSGLWIAMKISEEEVSDFVLFPGLLFVAVAFTSFQHASFLMKPWLYVPSFVISWTPEKKTKKNRLSSPMEAS